MFKDYTEKGRCKKWSKSILKAYYDYIVVLKVSILRAFIKDLDSERRLYTAIPWEPKYFVLFICRVRIVII